MRTLGCPGSDDVRRVDLRVRLADRSLRQTNPVLGVVAQLIDLAEQRLTASQMLDLAGSQPVRRRFRFDDDDIAQIEDWIVESGIRWGLDASHRSEYKLDGVPAGTWRAGLQRVLLGVAMSESGRRLYGRVLPVDDVESGAIDLAGRYAELVDRVGSSLEALRGPRASLAGRKRSRRRRRAHRHQRSRVLAALRAAPDARRHRRRGGRGADRIRIGLSEVRALLHHGSPRPTRANFRTGHLTVCTLVPMRSVPTGSCVCSGSTTVRSRASRPAMAMTAARGPATPSRRIVRRRWTAFFAAKQHLAASAAGVAVADVRRIEQQVIAVAGRLARERIVVEPEQTHDPMGDRAHRHERADGQMAGAEVRPRRAAGVAGGASSARTSDSSDSGSSRRRARRRCRRTPR